MTEHNDSMDNDTDCELNLNNPIDEPEKKNGEKPSGENNAETPWDSLRLQKEKEHIRKIKEEVDNIVARRELRQWTWLAGVVIILALLLLLYCRTFCGFDIIVDIYKEKGNTDILWFYGVSIFSIMIAFLSVALTFINIFVFKKKRTAEQEIKDPLSKVTSTLTEILDILKKKE